MSKEHFVTLKNAVLPCHCAIGSDHIGVIPVSRAGNENAPFPPTETEAS